MRLVKVLENSMDTYFPAHASEINYFILTGTSNGTLPDWKVETMISKFRHIEGFREFVLGFLGGDVHDLS